MNFIFIARPRTLFKNWVCFGFDYNFLLWDYTRANVPSGTPTLNRSQQNSSLQMHSSQIIFKGFSEIYTHVNDVALDKSRQNTFQKE